MTPFQYARKELAAGRFPSLLVNELVAGSVYLCDADWNVLKGSKTYTSRDAACADRSRILDRARKAEDK